jgi:hypothetical protein
MLRSTSAAKGGERSALPSALARFCCAALLCLSLLPSVAQGWLYLKRIAYLPFGQKNYGMVVLMDSDQDSLGEMTYHGYCEAGRLQTWEIVEYRPVNWFVVVRADTLVSPVPDSLCLGNFTPYA